MWEIHVSPWICPSPEVGGWVGGLVTWGLWAAAGSVGGRGDSNSPVNSASGWEPALAFLMTFMAKSVHLLFFPPFLLRLFHNNSSVSKVMGLNALALWAVCFPKGDRTGIFVVLVWGHTGTPLRWQHVLCLLAQVLRMRPPAQNRGT